MKKRYWILTCLVIIAGYWEVHKYYFSLTHMEVNYTQSSTEVTIQIFWDDLEKALSRRENKTITYEDSSFERLTQQYLRETFILSQDKKMKNFRWVGLEMKKDLVYCYFEYPEIINLSGYTLSNKVLMEDFPEQINLVHVTQALRKNSYQFQKNHVLFHL